MMPPQVQQRTLFKRIVQERPAWHEHAECRGLDPDLFFPERGEPTAPAKAVCAVCPVAVECGQYAIVTVERNGVWGGMSEKQRKTMRSVR